MTFGRPPERSEGPGSSLSYLSVLTQAHRSNKEERLLSASKTFDQGLSRHHLSSWDSILDPHVILHKDSITLYDDLHGLSTVKGYFQVRIFRRLATIHPSFEKHTI